MKLRQKEKLRKNKHRQTTQKELDRQRTPYPVLAGGSCLRSLFPEKTADPLISRAVLYQAKPSKKEVEFVRKFGIPSSDTWNADYCLIRQILVFMHATLEASDSIIAWDTEKVTIQTLDETTMEPQKKEVLMKEAVDIITQQFVAYVTEEKDGAPIPANVQRQLGRLACSNLGEILPALWW